MPLGIFLFLLTTFSNSGLKLNIWYSVSCQLLKRALKVKKQLWRIFFEWFNDRKFSFYHHPSEFREYSRNGRILVNENEITSFLFFFFVCSYVLGILPFTCRKSFFLFFVFCSALSWTSSSKYTVPVTSANTWEGVEMWACRQKCCGRIRDRAFWKHLTLN